MSRGQASRKLHNTANLQHYLFLSSITSKDPQTTCFSTMADSTTGRPSPIRIGNLRGFLPLSEELVSTRGQSLPSLIQNRSSASLKDLRGPYGPSRKHGKYNYESDEEMDIERDVDASIRESRMGGNRRMSNGSQALNTPQMRSMRLIGNSNPRYQWYVLCWCVRG